MFGIGMTEMIIIAVVALIFIGPDQIPEVAKTVGKLINDLKRSTDDLKRDLHQQTGLPKNFDEWLETRKENNVHSIAPAAGNTVVGGEDHDPYAGLIEDNHEEVVVTGHNGHGHDPVHGHSVSSSAPSGEAADAENQMAMNLDSDDDSKDPKKS